MLPMASPPSDKHRGVFHLSVFLLSGERLDPTLFVCSTIKDDVNFEARTTTDFCYTAMSLLTNLVKASLILVCSLLTTVTVTVYNATAEGKSMDLSKVRVILKSATPDGWNPMKREVFEAEQLFPNFILQNDLEKFLLVPLAQYGRQYSGVVSSGEKFIHIFGFCQSMGMTEEQLQNPILILDGGRCFFEVDFDIKDKTFSRFSFHGEA